MDKRELSDKINTFFQRVADIFHEDFGFFMIIWLLGCSTQVIKFAHDGKVDLVMSMAFTGLAFLSSFIKNFGSISSLAIAYKSLLPAM